MRRSEVWSVSLPATSGREQGGQRPAVVIQDDDYGQGSPLVLVIPITSQMAASRFPGSVEIAPTPENGLSLRSVAMRFQLRALDRTRFVRRLGTLSDVEFAAVFREVKRLIGLDDPE